MVCYNTFMSIGKDRTTIGVLENNSGLVVKDPIAGLLVVEGFEIVENGKTVRTFESTRRLKQGERVIGIGDDIDISPPK